jgi:hypothetical protein
MYDDVTSVILLFTTPLYCSSLLLLFTTPVYYSSLLLLTTPLYYSSLLLLFTTPLYYSSLLQGLPELASTLRTRLEAIEDERTKLVEQLSKAAIELR